MGNTKVRSFLLWLVVVVVAQMVWPPPVDGRHGVRGGRQYYDALSKCLLFFEGQRSGKLPPTQRMTWRKDSALDDGALDGVDLAGGYYDAGDNVKFGFPMAFTATMLAWSIIEFRLELGDQLGHAEEALRWGTDYLLKATAIPDKIYVQVGEPYADHNCWERPEDMDTPRTVYAVNVTNPGSEVAGETAAALAAASIVFQSSDPAYADKLLARAKTVYDFGYTNQGSYSNSLGTAVCPFYCDFSGYIDELTWGAAWLDIASKSSEHWNYIFGNLDQLNYLGAEFGWDNKGAGIHALLLTRFDQKFDQIPVWNQIQEEAEDFVCNILPESPMKSVRFTPGGLLYKSDTANLQNNAALSFILLTVARHLNVVNQTVTCGNVLVSPSRIIEFVKSQVDYVLGKNPHHMSYMVGYGRKFPQRIHHRGSSLPSMDALPRHMQCKDGTPYYESASPNPNLLVGAIVGGPNATDYFFDERSMFQQSEPTTYINAPMVGVLAFFSTEVV